MHIDFLFSSLRLLPKVYLFVPSQCPVAFSFHAGYSCLDFGPNCLGLIHFLCLLVFHYLCEGLKKHFAYCVSMFLANKYRAPLDPPLYVAGLT